MSPADLPNSFWFTRRDGIVRGPFPYATIASFILLGRIHDADELSQDRVQWQYLTDLPDLIPEVMRDVVTDEDRQRLLQARLRADERLATDRRQRRPNGGTADAEGQWQRRKDDRRAAEPELMQRHRQARERLMHMDTESPARNRRLLLVVGTVALLLAGGVLYWSVPVGNDVPGPVCTAPAAPGVNWSYCHLEGQDIGRVDLSRANLSNAHLAGVNLQGARLGSSDLSYANLGAANLRHTDLRGAQLKGAVLRNADLTSSDLSDANLSFANLLDARLGGVRLTNTDLSRATWVDGRVCAEGSRGECR